MARIRTIKPEFWSDDAITACCRDARLLYIGIWNFADDAGNLDRSAKQIKARVFPVDPLDCEPLIRELVSHLLLVEYEVDKKKYLHIPGFRRHQLINRPSLPMVPQYENSMRTHGGLTEGSVSTHDGLEGKGREGKGLEGLEGLEGKGGKGDKAAIKNRSLGKKTKHHMNGSRRKDPEPRQAPEPKTASGTARSVIDKIKRELAEKNAH